jgi:hypothetical protein
VFRARYLDETGKFAGVRGVWGDVYIVHSEDGVVTGTSLVGAGETVQISREMMVDGVETLIALGETATGASGRFYSVFDKRLIGDTDDVVGQALNGTSRMIADPGSIYKLDIWANQNHTILRPTNGTDVPFRPPVEIIMEKIDRSLKSMLDDGGALGSLQGVWGLAADVVIEGAADLANRVALESEEEERAILDEAGISFRENPNPGREPITNHVLTLAQ